MKLGLFGLGHLGKIHLKCLGDTSFEVVGFYDPKQLSGSYEGAESYVDELSLMTSIDACIIAATTEQHYKLAKLALTHGVHCLVEKPITATVEQARELADLAAASPAVITQVGFVERYNPAFTFIKEDITAPKFIEVHRLSQFNNRGNDVSVVQDLMIHDLDLLLNVKNEPILDIRATGVKVLTDSLDICNARIEFADRSIANVTASRMSMKTLRKFRIFQEDCYFSMDLDKKESQRIGISDKATANSMSLPVGEVEKHISIKTSGRLEGNAIVSEQNDFYNAIINERQPQADFAQALKVSELAARIEKICSNK